MSRSVTTYGTSRSVPVGSGVKFWEIWPGVLWWRKEGIRGQMSDGVEDQLEVSE